MTEVYIIIATCTVLAVLATVERARRQEIIDSPPPTKPVQQDESYRRSEFKC